MFSRIHTYIRSIQRTLFFLIDRFKIPQSERRVLSVLFLATLLIWIARLFIQHPQLIDPSMYEEEQAVFRKAFEWSYQQHQEILSRYGIQEESLDNSQWTRVLTPTDTSASPRANSSVQPNPSYFDTSTRVISSDRILVNINTANTEQLMTLPGIGPSYAERIIAWRNKNGSFTSIEQLLEIQGIGLQRLDKLRPFLEGIPADSTGDEGSFDR